MCRRKAPPGEQDGHADTEMNVSELFIKRPVMTILLMVGILVFGGVPTYRSLAISDMPTVDYPTITVNAALPDASPRRWPRPSRRRRKQFSTRSPASTT